LNPPNHERSIPGTRNSCKRGRSVGGIDFGFRTPFAAVWGTLDRDGVLWFRWVLQ